jgi:hypothetical protein
MMRRQENSLKSGLLEFRGCVQFRGLFVFLSAEKFVEILDFVTEDVTDINEKLPVSC